MKELFDRHAERLTPAQRQRVWRNLSGQHAIEPRPRLHWAIPATAATLAAGVLTVAVMRREPAPPVPAGTANPGASDSRVERVTPRPPLAAPADGPTGAPRTVAKVMPRHASPRVKPNVAALPELPPAVATLTESAAAAPVAQALPPATPVRTRKVTGVVTGARGVPVPFANVVVLDSKQGTMTDEQGQFTLAHVPVGVTSIKVQALGFNPRTVTFANLADSTTPLAVDLGDATVTKTLESIEVMAKRQLGELRSSSTKHTITSEKLRELPVSSLSDAVATKSGVVARDNALHFRGGRSGEVKFQVDGVRSYNAPAPPAAAPAPAQPPVIFTTGGTALPNDETHDSMFFKNYGVNPFIATDEDPLSTFAVDVDAGSYTLVRRYLGLGNMPPADVVRVEEFVNFFPQGYPKFSENDFRILIDGAPSPFGRDYQLLRIGIKGREISARNRKPARLTFVIDVSGSMAREDRLGLVKQSLQLLVDKLNGNDWVGIVSYGSRGTVLLEPRSLDNGRRAILDAIDQLAPEGSTNAEEGITLGYDVARRNFQPGAINRIVLCSDGVANVGRTGPESILKRARTEADHGVMLSTIGFGMGNYNDVLMEQLADKGDGNYFYVDDLREARRVFEEHMAGTLQTIAKDAKVQVEFDSTRVLRYRLLGFENRDVADRDFRNDKVDAGEIGAGHEVTALYEVKLAPNVAPGTLATVRFRYTRPEHEGRGAPQVREIAQSFGSASLSRRFEDASPHLRLDAAAAEFAELLRGSFWAKDGRYADALAVARSAASELKSETSTELVSLIETAARLKAPATGEEGK